MNYKIHSDSRRNLHEYEYPVTKILEAKEDCELGGHYHKLKEEVFVLVKGEITVIINGKATEMIPFIPIEISRLDEHSFNLKKGSVLIGFCTRLYDKNDDYPI